MSEISEKRKMRIVKDYLYPYWAKPSEETKKFVDKNFTAMSSAVIRGDRAFLEEVAVCLLLRWGYQQWRHFFSETLLKNSFLVSEKDVELSDTETSVVFILHLAGTQRNSYLEEAICNNYTYRDMLKKATVILSEVELPRVEELVKNTGKPVFIGKGQTMANFSVAPASNFSANGMDAGIVPAPSAKLTNATLGNIFAIKKVKLDGKSFLEVSFNRGKIKKYAWENSRNMLSIGGPAPLGMKWYEI